MKTNEKNSESEGNKKPTGTSKQERQWQDEFDDTAESAKTGPDRYENKAGIDAPDNNQNIPANQGAGDWRRDSEIAKDKAKAPQVGSESQAHADALHEGLSKARKPRA